MLTSMGSRSSRLTRKSRDALIAHVRRPRIRGDGHVARPRYPAALSRVPADDERDSRSPRGSPWGAATAAHQIEGGNVNNDWWAFEHDPRRDTARAQRRRLRLVPPWPEDVELVADLGLGAYRFSVEWSRIEPAEGELSMAALDHYRRMCAGCHELGIVPGGHAQPLHHPRGGWPTRGGWEAPDAPERFARFVSPWPPHLGDLVGWACTINEPNVVATMGYLRGRVPARGQGGLRPLRAPSTTRWCRAHVLAVEALRAGPGDFPVGLTLSMDDIAADEGGEELRDAAEEMLEDVFLGPPTGDDFVGVQCYTRMRFGPDGASAPKRACRVTQMGYEFWPQALEDTVRRAGNSRASRSS